MKTSQKFSILLILIHLSIFSCLEYKKSKNIKFSEKYENSNRLEEIENLNSIQDRINLKKSTFLIVFCVSWSNHCQDYLKTLETVSSYKLTRGFEFLNVDCTKHKLDICDNFQISAFPTIQVYINGNLTSHIPSYPDVESILEFIDKINSPTILKLKSYKEILNFSKNYGDSSFILVGRRNNEEESDDSDFFLKEIYKCYENVAMDINYRPIFYFSEISESQYKKLRNDEIKTPAILVILIPYNKFLQNLGINSEYNVHLHITPETTCQDITAFIEENKYPILKRLDEAYLTRIKREKKILLIAAIFTKDAAHINFLKTFFHNIAFVNKKFVFSYLDAVEDNTFLKYFNLNQKDIPKVIIYNFSEGKYFIDNYSYLNDDDAMTKLNELIRNIERGGIRWTSGYLIEDLLDKMGLRISRHVLLVVFLFCATVIFIIMAILVCRGLEKISKFEVDKKKKQ